MCCGHCCWCLADSLREDLDKLTEDVAGVLGVSLEEASILLRYNKSVFYCSLHSNVFGIQWAELFITFVTSTA